MMLETAGLLGFCCGSFAVALTACVPDLAPLCSQAYPGTAFGSISQTGTAGAAGQGAAAVMGGAGVAQFDPLAPVDVDKLNGAFMQRHQPALLGTFLRAS
jgi:hypothetical protein